MVGYEPDISFLIPVGSLDRLIGQAQSWRIVLEVMPDLPKDGIAREIEALFERDFRTPVEVRHAETMIRAEQAQRQSLTLLLAALGITGSNLYASLSLADLTLSPEVFAAALGLSTLAGLISGYLPARQSAKLDPVKALQSE